MIRWCLIGVLTVSAVIFAGSVGGCSADETDGGKEGEVVSGKTIEQVLKDKTDEWMAIPGVQGTGIGMSEGKPCIVIFSSVKPESLQDKIPSTVQGYPVVIKETGAFHALDP